MARWKLTIEGEGPGFSGLPQDVDQLAGRFLRTLADAGSQVGSARCIVGAQEGQIGMAATGFDGGGAPLPAPDTSSTGVTIPLR